MPKLDLADRFIAHLFLDRRAADRDDPLAAAEIAQITGLSIAEVDRRVERMEHAGVLGSAPSPTIPKTQRSTTCSTSRSHWS
jgi:hypothetical protein